MAGGVAGTAVADAGQEATGQGVFSRALRVTTAGVLLVVTLVAFEEMAVTTAMPTAVRDLHGLAYFGWPFTAFLVMSVVGIVISGGVCDRRGPRFPLVTGLGVFAVGLVIAGSAPWMAVFVVGRAVQGFGSGLVIVAVYVVVGVVYPESLRPKALAAMSSAWVLPSLLGPLAAGLLAEHLSWRLVFLGLAPLVALGLALLWPTLHAVPRPGGEPVARRGGLAWFAVMAAAGIGLLQYSGQHVRPLSLLPLAGGLVLLVPALRRLLPAGTLRLRRGLPAAIGMRGLVVGAVMGIDAYVPLALIGLHGFSPSAAGVPLTLAGLCWGLGSWIQGHRVHGDARRHAVRVGTAIVAVATGGVLCIAASTVSGWVAVPLWGLGGIGMGLTIPTVSVLVLDLSPRGEQGQNSAALQVGDVLSQAVAAGIGGVLLATIAGGHGITGPAFAAIDLVMLALLLAATAFAGRVAPGRHGRRRSVAEAAAP